MAENKTKTTTVDPHAFLAAVENPQRRADGQALATIMTRISGEPPVMWGPSIVGFGLHRYKYDSGREGEICSIGFSPRKTALVLYLSGDLDSSQALLDRLGKHERGRGCLYVKKLADVDADILEEMIAAAWAARL
jgi:hypothetical protein